MEIGDQAIDDVKSIPWANVKTRDPFIRHDATLPTRHPFERARARRPDRDNAAAGLFCAIDPRRGHCAQGVALPFHAVVLDALTAHWLERPRSHVKG